MDKIRDLLDKVEVLPLSPALLAKLLPKLSDVDTNFDEVVEIIAYDPALTSKLLQICNSAFFGTDSDVSTVAEAVNRVGYQSVYLLVAMINGSNCFPTPSPAAKTIPSPSSSTVAMTVMPSVMSGSSPASFTT